MQMWYNAHMQINGFEDIKKHFKKLQSISTSNLFLSFHKMRNGTPFVVVCGGCYAEAFCFLNKKIQSLCLATFDMKKHPDGKKYLFITSIKSKIKGAGVGSEVINVLKHHGIKNNCECIELISVKNARMFYDKLGFISDGEDFLSLRTYSFNLQELKRKKLKNLTID